MSRDRHPRDVNPLTGLHREVREARRAINGAKGRKARTLRNRAAKREAASSNQVD